MPLVLIPTAYRGPTFGEAEVIVEATSVRGALEAVEAKYPGFLPLVLDQQGGAHRFVKLFVNGKQIDSKALDQRVAASDRVEVLAAIAGG
jgi:molybdopterin converting factor small subunit